jgi:hypothetical protein
MSTSIFDVVAEEEASIFYLSIDYQQISGITTITRTRTDGCLEMHQ